MNILFVTSAMGWGGGEVWLCQVSQGLQARGHRITIVCRPGAELLQKINLPGIEIIPVVMTADVHFGTQYRLYRIIKERGIEVVCVNMEKELRLCVPVGWLANVPVVASREVDQPIKNYFVNRLYYKGAAAIAVNSHATRNTLLKSAPWLEGHNIPVIWKGIDPSRFSGISAATQESRPGVIAGFLGRLDEQKGVGTLLEAMALVAREDPALCLLIAGTGNLESYVEEFRSAHGLQKQIVPLGFQDAAEFLGRLDFLVMPSLWEGFGYSAVEAMAAGKPVIATNVSSLPEIITHEQDGLLVPPNAPEDLAAAILRLSRDSNLRKRLGAAARATVAERFHISAMIEKTERLFEGVVRK